MEILTFTYSPPLISISGQLNLFWRRYNLKCAKIGENGNFWPIFSTPGGHLENFQNYNKACIIPLWYFTMPQNFRKIPWAISEESCLTDRCTEGRTDGRTYGRYSYFPLKRRTPASHLERAMKIETILHLIVYCIHAKFYFDEMYDNKIMNSHYELTCQYLAFFLYFQQTNSNILGRN